MRVYLLGSQSLSLAIGHRVSLSCSLLVCRTWLSSTWRNELAPGCVLQNLYCKYTNFEKAFISGPN